MSEQDFLTVIREAEERAEDMVAEAQANARKRIEDVRQEADRLIAAAREEAAAITLKTLEDAHVLAGEKAREEVAGTSEKAVAIRAEAVQSIENAIRAVTERIVK